MGLTHPKPYKIRRVVKNSAAYGRYAYQVRCMAMHRIDDYLDIQTWAWETFGPSIPYEFLYYDDIKDSKYYNPAWCYQSELKARKYCIYLNEDALSLFLLKWAD